MQHLPETSTGLLPIEQHEKESTPMALITITRRIGCGERNIASRVAEELHLELYDDVRLEEEATRMGFDLREIGGVDTTAPNLLWQLRSNRPQNYLDIIHTVVLEIARRGCGVIVGHGSQMLLRDFSSALHVSVHASMDFRVQALMDEQSLTRDTAEKRIHRADHEQRGFLRFAFNIDWNDPASYDLMINRDKLSEDVVAKLITEVAKSQEVEDCSQGAQESMERMSFRHRVEDALLKEQFDPRDIHVEVPERGVVRVVGVVREYDEQKRLVQVVGAVEGVSKVEDEVAVLPLFVD